MVRSLAAILVSVLAGLLLAGWLLIGSPAGSRWLLLTVADRLGPQLSIAAIDGRLADRLVLQGVRVTWPGGVASLDRLVWHWSPQTLLASSLQVQLLEIGTLTVQLRPSGEPAEPSEPLQLAWPDLPNWLRTWNARVDVLRLAHLIVETDAGERLQAEGIHAALRLADGRLVVDGLEGLSGAYRLRTRLEFGVFEPGAEIDLTLERGSSPSEPELNLTAALSAAREDGLLAGPVSVSGRGPDGKTYRLTGRLRVLAQRLEFGDLLIDREQASGVASGRLALSWQDQTQANLDLTIRDWLLATQSGEHWLLEGQMKGSGWLDEHRGHFDLTSRGSNWQSGQLSGTWHGQTLSLSLSELSGQWLGGDVGGSAHLSWDGPLAGQLQLTARHLDPALLDPDWSGSVNLNGHLRLQSESGTPSVFFDTAFSDSRLRGLPLEGVARGYWHDDTLVLEALDVRGHGFTLQAQGTTGERLDLSLAVADLGGLIPAAAGSLHGRGWLRVAAGDWQARFDAEAQAVAYGEMFVNQAVVSLVRQTGPQGLQVKVETGEAGYANLRVGTLLASLQGDLDNPQLQVTAELPEGHFMAELSGQRRLDGWLVRLADLQLEQPSGALWRLESPVQLRIDSEFFELDPLRLYSEKGRLALAALLDRKGSAHRLDVSVEQFDPAVLSGMLGPWSLSGNLDAELSCTAQQCRLEARGLRALGYGTRQWSFNEFQADGLWTQAGLDAGMRLDLSGAGQVEAGLVASDPWAWQIPLAGVATLELTDLAAAELFSQPLGLRLPNRLSSRIQAVWNGKNLESLDFSSDGHFDLPALALHPDQPFVFGFELEGAGQWQDDNLRGELSIGLADRGRLSGRWMLPIAAEWPWRPAVAGALQGQLSGSLQDLGLLGRFVPELVQDTAGRLELDLRVDGSWQSPVMSGTLTLQEAGGYLPVSGIQLEQVTLGARLDGERIEITELGLQSGAGALQGMGFLDLDRWRPGRFELTLNGDNFTLVHLPELQLRISPGLHLSGTPEAMHLSGEIDIPFFLASGRTTRNPVAVSPDVILVDAPDQEENPVSLNLTSDVRLSLGRRVLVDLFGLDARLGGQLTLTGIDARNFSGNGEIYIEEGSYSTYGVKLKIDRGRAVYAGGPLDNPAIDILALRQIGEVRAGVQIRGMARNPEVRLYAEPAMADTDILSYIVLGRPISQAGGELDPLMLAVGGLLSAGDSAVLRNRLQAQFGIDSLEIGSETGQTEDTVLRLGKYLTPDLYLSYGYSLFSSQSQFGVRYRLSERWEAESNLGQESGADLYYRFEFD